MSSATPIVITLPGGRRVDAEVEGHLIHTDQPLENGGGNTGPSPFQLFLASIGTCAGIFVQGFCASRGLATEGIRVVELPELDAAGTLIAVDLELQLPAAFPPKYREALVRVVEQCSVKRAILAQPTFRVKAVAIAASSQPTA